MRNCYNNVGSDKVLQNYMRGNFKNFLIVQHFPPLLQNSGGQHCYWVDTKATIEARTTNSKIFLPVVSLLMLMGTSRNCNGTDKLSNVQVHSKTGNFSRRKRVNSVLENSEDKRPIDGCMLHCIYSGTVKPTLDCWTHLGTPPARPPRSPACTCRRTRPAGCSTPRCPHTWPPARGWCTRQYLQ